VISGGPSDQTRFTELALFVLLLWIRAAKAQSFKKDFGSRQSLPAVSWPPFAMGWPRHGRAELAAATAGVCGTLDVCLGRVWGGIHSRWARDSMPLLFSASLLIQPESVTTAIRPRPDSAIAGKAPFRWRVRTRALSLVPQLWS